MFNRLKVLGLRLHVFMVMATTTCHQVFHLIHSINCSVSAAIVQIQHVCTQLHHFFFAFAFFRFCLKNLVHNLTATKTFSRYWNPLNSVNCKFRYSWRLNTIEVINWNLTSSLCMHVPSKIKSKALKVGELMMKRSS